MAASVGESAGASECQHNDILDRTEPSANDELLREVGGESWSYFGVGPAVGLAPRIARDRDLIARLTSDALAGVLQRVLKRRPSRDIGQ